MMDKKLFFAIFVKVYFIKIYQVVTENKIATQVPVVVAPLVVL